MTPEREHRGRTAATRGSDCRSRDPGAPNLPDVPSWRRRAALDLDRGVFDDFELIEIDHYGPGDIGPEGTVKVAMFRLAGSEFSCAYSPIRHEWGFTPAVSLWIDCDDNNELQRLFDRLSDGGKVFMLLDDYGFSTRFGWVGDRYGVTWQLNVP
jgi:predicted 3-demethylubiquinone-9 3-methyltransferase (glyoxalase superfamily)